MKKKKANKTLRVNTEGDSAATAAFTEVGPNLVTPTGDDGGVFSSLVDKLVASLAFQPVKGGPELKAHPFREHLDENYDLTKIQELVFGTIYSRTEDFPLRSKLFLFAMCALFSGLPTNYSFNFSYLITQAWGGICEMTLRRLHQKTLREYFHSCRGHDTPIEPAIELLLEAIVASLSFSPHKDGPKKHAHPLKEHLLKHYDQTKLQMIIRGKLDKGKLLPSETKLFLFGISALFSGLPTPYQFNFYDVIADAFGGLAGSSLRTICKKDVPQIFKLLLDDSEPITDASPTEIETEPSLHAAAVVVEDDDFVQPYNEAEEEEKDIVVSSTKDAFKLVENLDKHTDENGNVNLTLKLSGWSVESIKKLFEHWAFKTLEANENKTGLSTLHFADKLGRGGKDCTFARLITPMKDFSLVNKQQNGKKAQIVRNCLDFMDGGKDEAHTLLKILVEKKHDGLSLMDVDSFKYTDAEVASLRVFMAPFSANQIGKLDQWERKCKGNTRFPPNVKKRLREKEEEDVLAISKKLLELVMDGTGKTKPCLYWHIKEPGRLVQRQIESALRAGLFEESLKFSYRKKKVIMAFGCDKDLEGTSMLARVVNRTKGNSREHCQLLAYVEYADEKHVNLEMSILEESSPVVKLLQLLLDDKLFSFNFVVKDGNGAPLQSRCHLLNLFDYDSEKVLPEVEVEVKKKADNYSGKAAFENVSVQLHDSLDSLNLQFVEKITISIELVLEDLEHLDTTEEDLDVTEGDLDTTEEDLDSTGDKKYVGYRLFKDSNQYPFYGMPFEKPLVVLLGSSVESDIFQVEGYISGDKKNSWAVQGQGESSSAVCNCIVCIGQREFYKDNPPSWMAERFPNNPHFQKKKPTYTDPPLREGEYCNMKLFQKWQQATGEGNFHVTKEEEMDLKRNVVFSVIKRPCLRIPPGKQTTGIMHGPHGIVTHFKAHLIYDLRAIDIDDSEWLRTTADVLKDLPKYSLQSNEYKRLQKENKKMKNSIEMLEERVALESEEVPPEDVQTWKDAIGRLTRERLDHAKSSGLGSLIRLKNGAGLLQKKVKNYLAKSSQKPRGEAEYAFLKSVETLGGAFQAEHGGFELTHGDGIDMLDHWDEICEIVSSTYLTNPIHKAKVVKVMEDSKKIRVPLQKICHYLKSQEKWDDTWINKLKDCICELYTAWLDAYPNQDPFPKLHDLIAHVTVFIESKGMYGRLSEESFEASHQRLKRERVNLNRISDTSLRACIFARRIQLTVKQEIESVLTKMRNSLKGKKRGPYKKKENAGRNGDSIAVQCGEKQRDGSYLLINSITAIKEEWAEIWDMAVKGRVPDSWHRVFQESESLGNVRKENAKFLHHK